MSRALLLIVTVASALTGTAWAADEQTDRPRHHSGVHDRQDRIRRAPPEYPVNRWMYSRQPIMLGPPPPAAPVIVAVPSTAPMRGFEPPARFSYYCNHPPGFFPAVSSCGGPWLEMGGP